MIQIDWNPVAHVGFVPVNWYGLTYALGFVAGGWLVWRWSAHLPELRARLESLMLAIVAGTVIGARLYYVAQNDTLDYLTHPWRIVAVWEGGLAYFGGLFGALLAAILYLRRQRISFWKVADVFAPAIAIGSAIGRISCGLDGMDYGTPTRLPWGVVYLNRHSYAPVDGVARHPDQYYELLGDLIIAGVLLKLRARIRREGVVFVTYLILFSVLRFVIFFVRGNVPPVALGLKNAQWTALAILIVAIVLLARRLRGGSGPRGALSRPM